MSRFSEHYTPSTGATESSLKQPELVEMDEFGLPVGDNSNQIGTRIGQLVCTHVPISYTSWNKVPKKFKDDIWNDLTAEYALPKTFRKKAELKMSGPYWKFKSKMRSTSYNLYPTDLERKANVPNGIKAEDWVKFCENEKTEKAIKMKGQNKKNRAMLKHGHCSGRATHARVRAKKRKLNPTKTITRDEVWEITHMRKDGTILPSAAPLMAQLNEIKQRSDYVTTSQSLDTDGISQLCGPPSRGRVVAIGSIISKTDVEATAHSRSVLAATQTETSELKKVVDNLSNKVDSGFSKIVELINGMQGTQTTTTSTSNIFGVSSPESGSHGTPTTLPHGTSCELTNPSGVVIAYGRICMDQKVGMAHGRLVNATEEKVVVDKIFKPSEPIMGNHPFAETLADVGVGGFLIHPKALILIKLN